MLLAMDHREASCIVYVTVGMFHQLEQSTICILSVTRLGIEILTLPHNMMCCVWLMSVPRGGLRQTSADIISVDECPAHVSEP